MRRPAHLSPRLRKQGLQDEAVALQRGDHVCEGLGARHQERPQHHAEHPPGPPSSPSSPCSPIQASTPSLITLCFTCMQCRTIRHAQTGDPGYDQGAV